MGLGTLIPCSALLQATEAAVAGSSGRAACRGGRRGQRTFVLHARRSTSRSAATLAGAAAAGELLAAARTARRGRCWHWRAGSGSGTRGARRAAQAVAAPGRTAQIGRLPLAAKLILRRMEVLLAAAEQKRGLCSPDRAWRERQALSERESGLENAQIPDECAPLRVGARSACCPGGASRTCCLPQIEPGACSPFEERLAYKPALRSKSTLPGGIAGLTCTSSRAETVFSSRRSALLAAARAMHPWALTAPPAGRPLAPPAF